MACEIPIKNRIKAMREVRNMTQAELGEAVDLTRQTIAAIEQRRYSPSLEVAFRMAKQFGCKLDDLFEFIN